MNWFEVLGSLRLPLRLFFTLEINIPLALSKLLVVQAAGWTLVRIRHSAARLVDARQDAATRANTEGA